jgi:hypothetical protein
VECEVAGLPWVQDAFPYQGRCVVWLRQSYNALDPQSRAKIDRALAGTGCDALFN